MDEELEYQDLLAAMKPRRRRITVPEYTPENALEPAPAPQAKPAAKSTAKTPPKAD